MNAASAAEEAEAAAAVEDDGDDDEEAEAKGGGGRETAREATVTVTASGFYSSSPRLLPTETRAYSSYFSEGKKKGCASVKSSASSWD